MKELALTVFVCLLAKGWAFPQDRSPRYAGIGASISASAEISEAARFASPGSLGVDIIPDVISSHSFPQGFISDSGFLNFQQGAGGHVPGIGGLGASRPNNGNGVAVTKSIFVHVAPDMPAPPPVQITAQGGPNNKHYKIVFIKTPSMPAPQIILPQVSSENSEKTLIYVLSENPKQPLAPTLNVNNVLNPSVPEVFLIKYDGGSRGQGPSDTSQGVNTGGLLDLSVSRPYNY